MPRSAPLAAAAAAILTVVPEAGAVTRTPIPEVAGSGSAVRPAVVMFELAIVRMRMLNTLTELIGADRAPAARRWWRLS